MNERLLGTQIESLTPKHGAEIAKFYGCHGFDVISYTGNCNSNGDDERFYGVDSAGNFDSREKNSGLKTLTLEEAKDLAYVGFFGEDTARKALQDGLKIRNIAWENGEWVRKYAVNLVDDKGDYYSFCEFFSSPLNMWEVYKESEGSEYLDLFSNTVESVLPPLPEEIWDSKENKANEMNIAIYQIGSRLAKLEIVETTTKTVAYKDLDDRYLNEHVKRVTKEEFDNYTLIEQL